MIGGYSLFVDEDTPLVQSEDGHCVKLKESCMDCEDLLPSPLEKHPEAAMCLALHPEADS